MLTSSIRLKRGHPERGVQTLSAPLKLKLSPLPVQEGLAHEMCSFLAGVVLGCTGIIYAIQVVAGFGILCWLTPLLPTYPPTSLVEFGTSWPTSHRRSI